MKNLRKKGFTIVELVIVIAVIAILAAILIPTFVSITRRANQSADQQAVAQMNRLLAATQASESLIEKDNDAKTSINIYNALIKEGYNYEFDAYYEKYSFGYVVDKGNAVIVLVEDNKIAFPKNYEGRTDYKEFFKAVENQEDLISSFDTGYVILKTDAVFTEAISISNNLTVVANDKTVEDDAHLTTDGGANSAVNINNASEDIVVNISGVNISNPDDLYARGLNFSNNTGKVTLVLENCEIKSHYYALNISSSNTGGLDIIVRNSTIEGWAALNVWSKANITFENCTLIGNDRSSSGEGFGTIVINSGAKDSSFTFVNCTIESNSASNNPNMDMANVRTEGISLTFKGCTYKYNGVAQSEFDITTVYDGVDYFNTTSIVIE